MLINIFRVAASFVFNLDTSLPCLLQQLMSQVTVLLCMTGNLISHILVRLRIYYQRKSKTFQEQSE